MYLFLLLLVVYHECASGHLKQRIPYYLPNRRIRLYNRNSNSTVNLVAQSAGDTLVAGSRTGTTTLDQYQLSYVQSMTAGAISRTLAQTIMHPANTYKTLLQLKRKKGLVPRKITLERLLRGVDAQFFLALPHGAFYFFVIDQVKTKLNEFFPAKLDLVTDFSSSAISTVICSIISTPQMVLTDRLMADVYPSFPVALRSIFAKEGIAGFYTGWWPALAQKIPSYSLTWMFFQQFKRSYEWLFHTKPNSEANFVLGALAAAGSVTVMNPMDTVKTRLVIQMSDSPAAYKGVSDCFIRIMKEEGIGAFYRSLPPRLVSVVPMIAIQFAVYETMKSKFTIQNKIALAQRLRLAAKFKKSTGSAEISSSTLSTEQLESVAS